MASHTRGVLIAIACLWRIIFVKTISSIETSEIPCEPPPKMNFGHIKVTHGPGPLLPQHTMENNSIPADASPKEDNLSTSEMLNLIFPDNIEVLYPEGSVAEYYCTEGYWLYPPHTKRTCHRGIWKGKVPHCSQSGCSRREDVINGYYLELTDSPYSLYHPESHLQFLCHSGYILNGPDKFVCKENGKWNPEFTPKCLPSEELLNSRMCSLPPDTLATTQKLMLGIVSSQGAIQGTIVEYRCRPKFRNVFAPCVPHALTCEEGQWRGMSPHCEPFDGCFSPPNIANGFVERRPSYPIHSQVYYSCKSGYRLLGHSYHTCEETGCWTDGLPICQRLREYPQGYSTAAFYGVNTVFVASVSGIIAILLMLLAAFLYHRALGPKLLRLRNSGSGNELQPHPPPTQIPPTNGQTQTEYDPDRVALIAFSDEGVPPTYEEAVRQRPTLAFDHSSGRYTPHTHRSRGHRVVVSGVRRSRHRDNPDNISYQSIASARQSSSTSRSMSVRSWSACDSLGSTDTVAISDSTNVTVETMSSGGGSGASQTTSCRGLAGSRASFDTSSLINNEGVPLLEEAEGEDQRADDEFSLSTRDSDSLKDNVSHTRSITVSLQE